MVNLRTTIRKNTSVTLLPLTDLAQSGARGTDFARSGYCARGRKHDTEPTDCPTIRRAERARHQSAAPWRLIVECSPARSRPCACAAACAWRRWNVLRRRKDHIDTSASRRTLSLPRFRGHPNERECSQGECFMDKASNWAKRPRRSFIARVQSRGRSPLSDRGLHDPFASRLISTSARTHCANGCALPRSTPAMDPPAH